MLLSTSKELAAIDYKGDFTYEAGSFFVNTSLLEAISLKYQNICHSEEQLIATKNLNFKLLISFNYHSLMLECQQLNDIAV